jgi:hypothetical protein
MMVKLGVRNNDLGILWRSNRYTIDLKEDKKQRLYGICWFAACIFLGFPLYVIWDMMVMHQSNKNIFNLIRKKLLKGKNKEIKNEDLINDKTMDENENDINKNDAVDKLNTLVNRIALFDVSADQVEEVGDAAVEA